MKFIPPLEIASQIMTLIQEAEKELIIVSPYINISDWDKMKKCLRKAIENNVKIPTQEKMQSKIFLSWNL